MYLVHRYLCTHFRRYVFSLQVQKIFWPWTARSLIFLTSGWPWSGDPRLILAGGQKPGYFVAISGKWPQSSQLGRFDVVAHWMSWSVKSAHPWPPFASQWFPANKVFKSISQPDRLMLISSLFLDRTPRIAHSFCMFHMNMDQFFLWCLACNPILLNQKSAS